MPFSRNLYTGLFQNFLIVIQPYAGFHGTQGIQFVIVCPLVDNGFQVDSFLFLCQLCQRLDNPVGSICRNIWSVHSQHIRQIPGHNGCINLVRVTAAAVIPWDKLNVRKICTVILLIKCLHGFPVTCSLVGILNGMHPDGKILLSFIVACNITRIRLLPPAASQRTGSQHENQHG